jgi:cysteine-rich repeat protein
MISRRIFVKPLAGSLLLVASVAFVLPFGCTDPTFEPCSDEVVCARGSHCTADKHGCTESRCGNGVIDSEDDEVCDDGNANNGDGCSSECKSE